MLAVLSLAALAFGVGLTGAMAPGPITALTITESARRGFRAGPLITLGHAMAEIVVVIALALGLSTVFQHSLVKGLIASLGGLVLIWMGSDVARGVLQGKLRLDTSAAELAPAPASDHVRTGFLLSLSNPYWLIWWATVGAGFVVQGLAFGVVGLAAVFLGHILSDLSWNSLLAFAASSGRRVLSPQVYRVVLLGCGVFVLLLGVSFTVAGVGFLRGA